MEKELNSEEKARKAEEDRATNVKKTLEWKLMQGAVGSNLVRKNPHLYTGELGFQSANELYEKLMLGEDAKKVKDQMYKERLTEREQLGIADEPSYTSNYDLIARLVRQFNEVLSIAKMDELYKAAKDLGAKLEFEVPQELKGYTQIALIQKALDQKTGKIDPSKLDDNEKNALGFYQVLSESYKRACALKASQANYFADLNAQGKQIADLYKKEDKGEKN